MLIPMDRVLFAPNVAVVAATLMISEGLDRAVTMAGIEDAAEIEGSPLNELIGRVAARPYGGNGDDIAEFAGRQCYRSWSKGRSHGDYIANVIDMEHGSVFQHASIVMQITGISRSLSHELVRHGTGTGFSQESQRYVDAADMNFVVPPIMARRLAGCSPGEVDADQEFSVFRRACYNARTDYAELQSLIATRLKAEKAAGTFKDATGATKRANEAARSVLPNAAETRMVFSANLRSIRYILSLRASTGADLEIRRLACLILEEVRGYAPEFFRAVTNEVGPDGQNTISALNGRI